MTATAEHLFEGGTPAVTIRVCPRGRIQAQLADRAGRANEDAILAQAVNYAHWA